MNTMLSMRYVGPGLAILLLLWFCAPSLLSAFCLNLNYLALLHNLPAGTAAQSRIAPPCTAFDTQPARHAFARGQVAFFAGDHAVALEQYAHALALGESSALVHWRVADLYAERGDTAAALDHWRAVGAAPFFLDYGLVLRHHYDWIGAEQALRRAVAIDPTNAYMVRVLGEFYWEWGKPSAADLEFAKAFKLETSPYLRAVLHGWRLEIQGNHQAAERFFRDAIALDPARPEAYRRLADTLVHSGQPEQAIATLAQGAEHVSMPFGIYLHLGQLLEDRGDFVGAEQAYERAEWYDVLSDESWRLRGQNALAWGHLEAAENYFARALELEPNNAETHYWRGRVLTRLGRCEQARTEFRRAAEIAPGEARYRLDQNPAAVCP